MGLGLLQCDVMLSVNQAILQHCNMKTWCEYIVRVVMCPFVVVRHNIFIFMWIWWLSAKCALTAPVGRICLKPWQCPVWKWYPLLMKTSLFSYCCIWTMPTEMEWDLNGCFLLCRRWLACRRIANVCQQHIVFPREPAPA